LSLLPSCLLRRSSRRRAPVTVGILATDTTSAGNIILATDTMPTKDITVMVDIIRTMDIAIFHTNMAGSILDSVGTDATTVGRI